MWLNKEIKASASFKNCGVPPLHHLPRQLCVYLAKSKCSLAIELYATLVDSEKKFNEQFHAYSCGNSVFE